MKILNPLPLVTLILLKFFLFVSCRSQETHPQGFARIKDGKISVNDTVFHVVAINYRINLRQDSAGNYFPNRGLGYEPNSKFSYRNPQDCLNEIRKDFLLCKEMGYNTVRVVGIGEANIVNQKSPNPKVYYAAFVTENYLQEVDFRNAQQWNNFQSAISQVLDIASEIGVKIIFTTKLLPNIPMLDEMLESTVKYHKGRNEILAYDFLNEPLYFDSVEHSKKEIYLATRNWNRIVKNNSPHLTTIGLACQRELFVWDPNVVDVDFISFHPYEYEKNQVISEIYWYSKFVNKPWILGETGIPADNDSIPYSAQVDFAKKTLYQEMNCNGNGYSWWQYKDVYWDSFHQTYLGVVNHKDSTLLSNGEYVHGTPKDLGKNLPFLLTSYQKSTCQCPDNYYNFSENTYFSIKGKVVNEDGKPIEGAGILAWDEFWVNHYFTTTRADGTFELFSDYKFYHWMVSALEHDKVYLHFNPDNAVLIENTLTLEMGEMKLKEVDLGD